MGQYKISEGQVQSHHIQIHTYFIDWEHYHNLIMMGLLTDCSNIDPITIKARQPAEVTKKVPANVSVGAKLEDIQMKDSKNAKDAKEEFYDPDHD